MKADWKTGRTIALTAVWFLWPQISRANPVIIEPQSLIAFGIIAFWALVIESALVTLFLISQGIVFLPFLGTLIAANAVLFLAAFLPLTGRIPLWVLEAGVVLADAVLIKLLVSVPWVQGGAFAGVTWTRGLVASLAGNAASFFVGVLASGSPWEAVEAMQSLE